MTRMEELLAESTIKSYLESKLEEEKTKKCLLVSLAVVGVIALVAAVSYAVYRLMFADEEEDLDDDLYFDDDDLVDFFDDDEENQEEAAAPEEAPAAEEAPVQE